MRKNQHGKIRAGTIAAAIAMLLAVCYCAGLFYEAFGTARGAEVLESLSSGTAMDYENTLFDTSTVHTMEISISEAYWQRLKDTALEKNYYSCDLTIDGETVYNTGIRTKGNSTLLQSILYDWDRLSLVFQFDKFNSGQTYRGLDMLSLYNNACDSSCLRDMLSFELMREMGVPTPLVTYAALYLNGEYLGLYTVMEGVNESFAQRNYGTNHGQLYKPEPSDVAGMLRGTATDVKINIGALFASEDDPSAEVVDVPVEVAALQYQGDDLSDYELIWANAIFDINAADKRRLVRSLEKISLREDIAQTVDLRELAAYFAVNTFLMNSDCYTTNMGHNYYLYEKDGMLSMIPWDYDQSMGAGGVLRDGQDMTELLNLAIDTPVVQTTVEERPMLACLLESKEGLALYHEALEQLCSDYLESGWLSDEITRCTAMIDEYVTSDPLFRDDLTKHEASVRSVEEFVRIRTESIRGQLDGSIPSTTVEQQGDRSLLVDASDYYCPESADSENMFLPADMEIGAEQLLKEFNDHTSVLAFLRLVSLDGLDFGSLFSSAPSEEGTDVPEDAAAPDVEETESSGLSSMIHIYDESELMHQIIRLVWLTARGILLPVLAVILLLLSIALLRKSDRKRAPCAAGRKRR